MSWFTSPIRPRSPLKVEFRGKVYVGWVSQIFKAIISHEISKGNKLPQGWENEVWSKLAQKYPYFVKHKPDPEDAPVTVSVATITSFLNVMRKRMLNSDLVDDAEAKRRATICAKCPKAAPMVGCSACKALARQMMKTPKASLTSPDKNSCSACGCYIDVKVWLPLEVLGEAAEHPYHESCWMRD
jgi:hypothetical protein